VKSLEVVDRRNRAHSHAEKKSRFQMTFKPEPAMCRFFRSAMPDCHPHLICGTWADLVAWAMESRDVRARVGLASRYSLGDLRAGNSNRERRQVSAGLGLFLRR